MTEHTRRRIGRMLSVILPAVLLIGMASAASRSGFKPPGGSPQAAEWASFGWTVLVAILSSVATALAFVASLSWIVSSRWTRRTQQVKRNTSRLDDGNDSVREVPYIVKRLGEVLSKVEKTEEELNDLDEDYVLERAFQPMREAIMEKIKMLEKRVDTLEQRQQDRQDRE